MKNTDCWYTAYCNKECEGCILFQEMSFLVNSSDLPITQPTQLFPIAEDREAFIKLKQIKDNITDFITKHNLYICSQSTGTGKTTWACKIMLSYFSKVWLYNGFEKRGLFVNVQSFLNRLKDFSNPLSTEYLNSLKNVDLVIWDDIGSAKYMSNFEHNQLLEFIDYRTSKKKANIYTSNITSLDELSLAVGTRLASRIWNNSIVVELKSKDMRGNIR